MSAKSRQSGFTLVEIMIALVIGLFLTAGMLQMYVANKHSFRFSDSLSRIQENGRYALAFIARDMRMADFWGCSRGEGLFPNGLNAGCTLPDATSTNAILGTDGVAGVPDAPDSINLRGAVGTGLVVDATTGNDLYVEGTVKATKKVLKTGDIALVSDCQGGDLFQVTKVKGGSPTLLENATGGAAPGNKLGILFNAYANENAKEASVHAWRDVRFFVQDGSNGENALFIQENACTGGAVREVVEGVENMQISYGEDEDGDGTADRYVRATNLTTAMDWDRVISVRVSLLLASPATESFVDEAQQIRFDDYDGSADTFAAPDNRLYQVVTATFAVRNRTH